MQGLNEIASANHEFILQYKSINVSFITTSDGLEVGICTWANNQHTNSNGLVFGFYNIKEARIKWNSHISIGFVRIQ